MKKFLSLLVVSACLFIAIPVSQAQNSVETPTENSNSRQDIRGDQIERIRQLTLLEYAEEIAKIVIDQLEAQKELLDIIKDLQDRGILDDFDLPEIVIPTEEEVINFVFRTVEGLGGMAVEEALVGVVVDDISNNLYTELLKLPFNELQWKLLHFPSKRKLTEEEIAVDAIRFLKIQAFSEFGVYTKFRARFFRYLREHAPHGNGLEDLPSLERENAGSRRPRNP